MTQKTNSIRLIFWAFPMVLVLSAAACCPSGVWIDNFKNVYYIVSNPSPTPGLPRQTEGNVDTRGFGCGVWPIRPLTQGDPVDPNDMVGWIAENPYPNANDKCCYSFLFKGNETEAACLTIMGQFQNIGGKCHQSGPMILEAFRQEPTLPF